MKNLITLILLFLTTSAFAKVQIINDDIKPGTLTEDRLSFGVVNSTGDTMTGQLYISPTTDIPALVLHNSLSYPSQPQLLINTGAQPWMLIGDDPSGPQINGLKLQGFYTGHGAIYGLLNGNIGRLTLNDLVYVNSGNLAIDYSGATPHKFYVNGTSYFSDSIYTADSSRSIQERISANNIKSKTIYTGTLGVGTPFYSFIAPYDMTISTISLTLQTAGSAGNTSWKCSNGAGSDIFLVTDGSYVEGSLISNYAPVDIAKNDQVNCLIDTTTQIYTPTGILEIIYFAR